MLIQDFVQIRCPFAQVRDDLLRDPHEILDEHISAGYHDGEALLVTLGPSLKHPRLGKKVWVDFGKPYSRGDGLVLPVAWWARGPSYLFPCLDGDLEVTPLGDFTTQITLMGRYEPPLGAPGTGLDRVLLHRVAEASVRSFLSRLSDRLQQHDSVATTGMLRHA